MPKAQAVANFALALRTIRQNRGLTQEDFDSVSSRVYISALERGLKQPTLAKVDELAAVLGVHPLTVLTMSYVIGEPAETASLLSQVLNELQAIDRSA